MLLDNHLQLLHQTNKTLNVEQLFCFLLCTWKSHKWKNVGFVEQHPFTRGASVWSWNMRWFHFHLFITLFSCAGFAFYSWNPEIITVLILVLVAGSKSFAKYNTSSQCMNDKLLVKQKEVFSNHITSFWHWRWTALLCFCWYLVMSKLQHKCLAQ